MSVDIRDLTGGGVDEAGLYEELMRTSKSHLLEEYNAGRITGGDYGTVYLGVMQSNLQTASQFLLQYELHNEQLALVQEQVLQAKKQNELLDLQKAQLTIQNATAQYNLDFTIPEQYAQLQEQTKLVIEQVANAIKQGTLLGSQNTQVVSQTALVTKQEDLVDEQILDAKDKLLAIPLSGLNNAQFDKITAEAGVLEQRKLSEQAQTVGTIDANGNASVGGILGRQMELFHTQKEGFLRDAEQKAAKIFTDTTSIAASVDPVNNAVQYYGFSIDNAETVLKGLVEGIGGQYTAAPIKT